MVLSDFLTTQKHDDSNPQEMIPIPFNMSTILQEQYYRKFRKISSSNMVSSNI